MKVRGDTVFFVNQMPVMLPPGSHNFELLLKLDTGCHNVR